MPILLSVADRWHSDMVPLQSRYGKQTMLGYLTHRLLPVSLNLYFASSLFVSAPSVPEFGFHPAGTSHLQRSRWQQIPASLPILCEVRQTSHIVLVPIYKLPRLHKFLQTDNDTIFVSDSQSHLQAVKALLRPHVGAPHDDP